MRMRLSSPVLLALPFVFLAGCSPSPAPPAGPAEGAKPSPAAATRPGPDTLVIAIQADIGLLNTVVQQSATDSWVSDNLFRGLLTGGFNCRIEYAPDLAESYEFSPDGLTLTFHMRKGEKWSDGQEITAKDVKFSYDLVADPKVASPRLSYVENIKPEARPRIIDDYTVAFEFTHTYDRLTMLSHATQVPPLPEHVLAKEDRASLRSSEFEKNPVVSGAWKIGKWEKNSTLTLVPNENYTGSHKPTLARIILKIIPEYATRLVELENGSVDSIEVFQTIDDIARIEKAHPEMKIYDRGQRFLDYIAWNSKNPLFADRDLRRALTMAIDRQKLVKDLLTTPEGKTYGGEAYSNITPELCDYRSESVQFLPFDPEKAKAALGEKGWKDTNGDGILDKGGKPFRFTLLTNSGNVRRAKASVIVQANLKAVGVDAQLEQVESNTFFERLRKKDYEASLSGWSAALFIDPTEVWHCDSPGHAYQFNFTSYCNPKADELMDKALKVVDPKESAPLWKDWMAMLYEDQPYTFLFWRSEVLPLHSRFQGAKVNISSPWQDWHEWWVPEDKVKYKPLG